MRQYFAILFILIFSGLLCGQSMPGAAPGTIDKNTYVPIGQQNQTSAWEESVINSGDFIFATTTYTFQDIVVFSYFDDSFFYLIAQDGTPLDSIALNENEFHSFSPGQGIYRVEGNNSFSLLIGDPISNRVLGYFAVDESGNPISTRLNTFMPGVWGGLEKFIVFGYNDNTEFTVKNLTDTTVIAAGILNKGEHVEIPEPYSKFLSVIANKPVSALSYADQGYFVPSTNGTFTGTHFYGFSGYIGSWANGIVITPYHDSTNYLVLNSVTGDTIEQGVVSIGEATEITIYTDTYWEVTTDMPATAANLPYAGWSGGYAYLARQIDESGHGIGTHFLTPVISGNYDIFSFEDDNQITIVKRETADTVYNDVLNAGENYNYFSSKGVYEVMGTQNLSIVSSTSGSAGGDFVPLNFAVGLPDISISSADILFDPDSADRKPGDAITIYATVHNYGFETAYEVPVQFYDGDPRGELFISPIMYADSIPAGESFTFSTDWTVPDLPEYHAVYVIIDRFGSIVESNSSNNKSFRFIVPNQDLLPPLSTVVDAPVSVKVDGDSIEFDIFDICVSAFNTGDVDALNAYTILMLPAGLSTTDADSVNFGNVAPSATVETCWSVNIDSLPNGTVVVDGNTSKSSGEEAFFYSIKVNADNAEEKWINRMLLISRPTSLSDETERPSTPESFNLKQNFPNPFNPVTTIEYQVPKSAHVILEVYDVTGRKVSTLVNNQIQAGYYKAVFDGSQFSSGVFFIRLNVDGKNYSVRRMMMIK